MAEENTEASLSTSDLVVLTNLTQAAAQRGAIRADEMQVVGAVYEKLVKFLTAAGVLNKPAASTEEPVKTDSEGPQAPVTDSVVTYSY